MIGFYYISALGCVMAYIGVLKYDWVLQEASLENTRTRRSALYIEKCVF